MTITFFLWRWYYILLHCTISLWNVLILTFLHQFSWFVSIFSAFLFFAITLSTKFFQFHFGFRKNHIHLMKVVIIQFNVFMHLLPNLWTVLFFYWLSYHFMDLYTFFSLSYFERVFILFQSIVQFLMFLHLFHNNCIKKLSQFDTLWSFKKINPLRCSLQLKTAPPQWNFFNISYQMPLIKQILNFFLLDNFLYCYISFWEYISILYNR